ncbi:hypothetical protein BKA63DRAFT_519240 [Paraphoma chrysanthemicola]|nr:hypothetical protein BKA63DRAFT_519240 [Paraphoma chrysanthemicola]
MTAPPYSPLAGEGERQLPHYTPIIWQEEINPFDEIRRDSHETPSVVSHDDDLIAPTSTPITADQSGRATARFPLVTARTFPAYEYDPWSAIRRSQAFEPPKYTPSYTLPPPGYDPIDTQARTFRLRAPFIYASKTSNLPRYQLAQDVDRGGKSTGLKLRRLRPNETRACSVPAAHAARAPKISYDDNETLYTMDTFELHGHGEADLVGNIQITSGRTLWGGSWMKIWHVTKSDHSRRDSWNSDLDLRHSRRAQTSFDGERILLYSIRKGVWEDGDGTIVAREERSGKNGKMIEITEAWARDRERRDLVVACWVMKIWSSQGLRWEGM